MDVKEISKNLSLISKLMEIKGENGFKIRAFQNVSRKILQIENFEEKVEKKNLSEIKGIGKTIEAVIYDFYENDKSDVLEELKNDIPEGIFDMLGLKGLGAKKIKVLLEKLGITSVGELEYACNENRLLNLKGFGEKSQKNILKSIELFKVREKNLHYPEALNFAKELLKVLNNNAEVIKIAYTGELRRKCEIVNKLEFVVVLKSLEGVFNSFEYKRFKKEIYDEIVDVLEFKIYNITVFLYVVTMKNFNKILFLTTGSKVFIKNFLPIKNFHKEGDFFRGKKMIFVPPECRENHTFKKINNLVNYNDIQGIFHVHSTYSDGVNTLEDIVKYLIEKGYRYLGISDHSKSAYYANGLKEDDIKRQHEEIDQLNEKYFPFKIFKGIESDILKNGDLDYNENILQLFDFIIASVHSSFNLSEKDMTERIINAVKNPYTTIIGHPTGRLLLYREPYKLNVDLFLEAVAEYGKFIEINSHPYRLDLNWGNCIKAKEMGIKLFINPDVHNMNGFEHVKYGINVARKAGLSKNDIINSKNTNEVIKQLAMKNSAENIGCGI